MNQPQHRKTDPTNSFTLKAICVLLLNTCSGASSCNAKNYKLFCSIKPTILKRSVSRIIHGCLFSFKQSCWRPWVWLSSEEQSRKKIEFWNYLLLMYVFASFNATVSSTTSFTFTLLLLLLLLFAMHFHNLKNQFGYIF